MRCGEARKEIYITYQARDRASVTGVAANEAESHLAACPECQKFFASEEQIRDLVRSHFPRATVPPTVRERMLGRIAVERVAPFRARSPFRKIGSAPKRVVAASAVLLLLALLPALWMAWTDAGLPGSQVTLNLIRDHVSNLSLDMDVASSDIHAVQEWLRQRMDFSFELPAAAQPPLIGGRLCLIDGRRAALIAYQFPKNRASLFIFDGAGIQLPEGRLVSLDGKLCMIESAQGYNVVAWKQRGLLYGLVSDANSAELLQLAARF